MPLHAIIRVISEVGPWGKPNLFEMSEELDEDRSQLELIIQTNVYPCGEQDAGKMFICLLPDEYDEMTEHMSDDSHGVALEFDIAEVVDEVERWVSDTAERKKALAWASMFEAFAVRIRRSLIRPAQ